MKKPSIDHPKKPKGRRIGRTLIYEDYFDLTVFMRAMKEEPSMGASPEPEEGVNNQGRRDLNEIAKIGYLHYFFADPATRVPTSGRIRDILKVFRNEGVRGVTEKMIYQWRDEPAYVANFKKMLTKKLFSFEAQIAAAAATLDCVAQGNMSAIKWYSEKLSDYEREGTPADAIMKEMVDQSNALLEKRTPDRVVGKPKMEVAV